MTMMPMRRTARRGDRAARRCWSRAARRRDRRRRAPIRSSRSTARCSRSTSRSTATSSSRSRSAYIDDRAAASIRTRSSQLLQQHRRLLLRRQRRCCRASRTRPGNDLGRVIVNTVFGLGGLIDIASEAGIPRGDEDFGQTFGHWGIPQGPYLFIPLFGPTTVRDGTGLDRALLCSARSRYIQRRAGAQRPVRPRLRRPARAGAATRTTLVDKAALDPLHVHPPRLPAAPRVPGLRWQAAAPEGRRRMKIAAMPLTATRCRRASLLSRCRAARRCAAARAGGARRAGQARVAEDVLQIDQGRSEDPGRRPGAHPRSDRDEAAAELRLHAHDRARDGPQLAAGDARAAEAAHRRVPHAARAHVLERADAVPRRDDRRQAAARRRQRHRRRPCAPRSSARAGRRCRSTTA